MRTAARNNLFGAALLIPFGLLTILPILGIVLLSLQPADALLSGIAWPDRLHLENYARAFGTAHFSSYLASSFIVAITATVGALVVSVLAGYAFGTMQFRGQQVLFYLLMAGLIVPFEAIIVPLHVQMRGAHLTNTYWSVILPLIGTNATFGTFWMRACFRDAPRQLIESAALDGAGPLRILWQVLLPAARPAILVLVVLVFLWTWNDFLLPLVMLSRENLRTAPLGLAFFAGRYQTDRVGMGAAAVMIALPVVVLYIATQRRFIQGLWAGALKE
jgi:raffinose/stachyose/melibiose transport system permease protein